MALDIVPPNKRVIPADSFPIEQTGKLAQELALRTVPLDAIAYSYNLTTEQLLYQVKNNELLRNTIAAVKKEVANSGSDAGFNLRVKAVTEAMLPEALNLVQDPATRDADKARIISTFMTHNTNTERNKIAASGGFNTAVNVVFNADSGIRGIGPKDATVTIDQPPQ